MLDSTGLELGKSLDDSSELISELDSTKGELESSLDDTSLAELSEDEGGADDEEEMLKSSDPE